MPTICRTGYVNIGGPLNIQCVNDTWTQFPSFALNISNVSITPTMKSTKVNLDAACPADPTTYSIENGVFARSSTLTHIGSTYRGISICAFSYMIDPAMGCEC
ncbi:hypothetical protein I4U23_016298 [Adineta vaga]|nr:hypothetical protein I4U23_016298 [Adineta vaga]